MGKYLYGAAVQGIQSFIFQTNELKDIVGASELVENICTELFAKALYGEKDSGKKLLLALKQDDNAILNAAGNIKYIFNNREDCEKIVREFPKRVVEYAPGITISQAVVEMEDATKDFEEKVNELENLLRIQRNKPMQSTTVGLMGVLRSRLTNMPVVEHIVKKEDDDVSAVKGDYLDSATFNKRYHKRNGKTLRKRTTKGLCVKAFGLDDAMLDGRIAYDVKSITGKNDWIAVIHADGNGLGQVVQKVGHEIDAYKKFSQGLNEATKAAAVAAFDSIHNKFAGDEIIPIRPIVLGGDDLTVICRADFALEYVERFIHEFELETNHKLGGIITKADDGKGVFTKGKVKDRLTACAGIAFVKSSYPFYYAYELAEALCTRAKKDAKSAEDVMSGDALPPSCVMFHKVQDSFVEDFDSIAKRELTAKNSISFEYGPYYLHGVDACEKNKLTIGAIFTYESLLDSEDGNAVKSHLRNWLSLLEINPGMAKQKLIRMKQLFLGNEDLYKLICSVTKEEESNFKTPVYDVLSLHTLMTQETNNIK